MKQHSPDDTLYSDVEEDGKAIKDDPADSVELHATDTTAESRKDNSLSQTVVYFHLVRLGGALRM